MTPKLVAIAGPLSGSSFSLPERDAYVGRAPYNWLTVNSLTVSRQHFLVENTAAGWRLTDLDSHNGTFVNDTAVKERLLANGDNIRIGDSQLLFISQEEDLNPPLAAPLSDETIMDTRTLLAVDPGSPFLQPPPAHATKAEKQLNALLRISAAAQTVRAADQLEAELLTRMFEILPLRRAVLFVREPSGLVPLAWAVREGPRPGSLKPPYPAMVDQVVAAKIAILAEETGAEGRFPVITTPLMLSGAVTGVLYLEGASGQLFNREHLDMANALAAFAASAMENVSRIQSLQSDRKRLLEEAGQSREMVGESVAMRKIYDLLARVAPADTTVLILGENGTGKELAARAIHRNSHRRDKPFIAINCATLKDALLESELFGHEKGSFTGAVAQKKGKIEYAEGGTLFLDEIGELDSGLQSKLLRVLQEREFERVGGNQMIKADIRLLAATNRDIRLEVREGRFREDLFYRLNVVAVSMPALRQRREDIPLLASHFVSRFAAKINRPVEGISTEARALLVRHDWPGNVRELENTVERAVVLGASPMIQPEDLPETLLESAPDPSAPLPAYHQGVQEAKRKQILDAIQKANGNVSEAARALGVHPNYLHRLVTKLGLRDQITR